MSRQKKGKKIGKKKRGKKLGKFYYFPFFKINPWSLGKRKGRKEKGKKEKKVPPFSIPPL